MRRAASAVFLLILAGTALAGQAPSRARALFDGKTTAGWRDFKKPVFPDRGGVEVFFRNITIRELPAS